MPKGILTLLMVSSLWGAADAAVVLTEAFAYPDGDLTSAMAWDAHSGGVASPVQVVNGEAIVNQDTGVQDVHIEFPAQVAATLTYAFDMVVTAANAIGSSGSDFEHFAHFRFSNTAISLLHVRPSLDTDYTLGISADTPGTVFTPTTGFSFGDVVPVSVTLNYQTGVSTLTVAGQTVATDPVDPSDLASLPSIDEFALRQSRTSSDETIRIDNLVISTTAVPEPSAFLLLGCLTYAGLLRRKSKWLTLAQRT